MSFQIRKRDERGAANYNWLQSWHTFSFGRYHDVRHEQFRALRVMNEDIIQPGGGFGMHPHANMEILTFVLDGSLEHQDSMGNGGLIRPGEVQRMSAGRGIRHSEMNPSSDEPVHLYQIWLLPNRRDGEPEYEQTSVSLDTSANALHLIAAPDKIAAAMQIHADAQVLFGAVAAGHRIKHSLNYSRDAWLQVLSGAVEVSSSTDRSDVASLTAGDGLAVLDEKQLNISATEDSQILLFELG
ncbi:MAG: pirin family protein [Fuerstiella sp.]